MTSEEKVVFRKSMQRDIPLLVCEYWVYGEREDFAEVTGGKMSFNPLFIYKEGTGVSVYYNYSDLRQVPAPLGEHFNKNPGDFEKRMAEYQQIVAEMQRAIQTGEVDDVEVAYGLLQKGWLGLSLTEYLPRLENVEASMQSKALEIRAFTEGVFYKFGSLLFDKLEEGLEEEVRPYIEVMLFNELTGSAPPIDVLKERKQGYIYYDGKVYTENPDRFAKQKNFRIVFRELAYGDDVVSGTTAYSGKANGRVRLVFEESQFSKVQEGDILVTPMTVPSFLPVMKRAAAFVTDEGGITCHASIVAREMKKPCIVGTQNATQVLGDGDEIEVDAERGVVTVLKRCDEDDGGNR